MPCGRKNFYDVENALRWGRIPRAGNLVGQFGAYAGGGLRQEKLFPEYQPPVIKTSSWDRKNLPVAATNGGGGGGDRIPGLTGRLTRSRMIPSSGFHRA